MTTTNESAFAATNARMSALWTFEGDMNPAKSISPLDPSYLNPFDGSLNETVSKTEIVALRNDAARYRWLRHGDNDEEVLMTVVPGGKARKFDHRYDGFYLPRAALLDEAIDAEMAKEPKP